MIRTIIDELKNGNERIPVMFVALETKWSELLANVEDLDESSLADILSDAQWQIENICGERNLAKVIMPWSAFAHLYSAQVGYEGNGPQALKLSKAFEKSTCSLEVKFGARSASSVYHVSDFE